MGLEMLREIQNNVLQMKKNLILVSISMWVF